MAAARAAVVLVTCPSRAAAGRLARALVRAQVAACVNVVPGVTSLYRWRGRIERSAEVLLIIKTTRAQVEALRREVVAHHPYEVPEVLALPVSAGHRPYLAWVRASVRPASRHRGPGRRSP